MFFTYSLPFRATHGRWLGNIFGAAKFSRGKEPFVPLWRTSRHAIRRLIVYTDFEMVSRSPVAA